MQEELPLKASPRDENPPKDQHLNHDVMTCIYNFLVALWRTPEQLCNEAFSLEQAQEAGRELTRHLWQEHCRLNEELAEPWDPSVKEPNPSMGTMQTGILRAMAADMACSTIPSTHECSYYFNFLINYIPLHPEAANRFTDYLVMNAESSGAPPASVAPQAAAPVERLSGNQRAAFEFCCDVGELFFSGHNPCPGFKIRSFPLIAGPTGSGKSHLVREIANAMGCQYARLDYGTWLPRGAREGPPTLEYIGQLALKHERVLIHLDELDKMRSHFADGWGTSIKNDIWRLLDRPVNLDFLASAQSHEEGLEAFNKLFAERVWVVGSGTWQELFDLGEARPLGFLSENAESPDSEAMIEEIHKAKVIAPELVARFNSKIQVIRYPEAKETAVLLENAGIQLNDTMIRELDERMRHSGFRAVEDIVTEQCIAAIKRGETAPGHVPEMVPAGGSGQANDAPSSPITQPSPHASSNNAGQYFALKSFGQNHGTVVQVLEQNQQRVKLRWWALQTGIGPDGPVRGLRPIPHLGIWDRFARDWDLPTYQEVSLSQFEAFDRSKIKPQGDRLFQADAELYTFWRDQVDDAAWFHHRARALAQKADAIRQFIYPEVRLEALQEAHYDISAALMTHPSTKAATYHRWGSPNLAEQRKEAGNLVDRGLCFLARFLPPAEEWCGDIYDVIEDLDRRLIKRVIQAIESDEIIYRQLSCPEKLDYTLKLLQPELEWEELSDVMQGRLSSHFKALRRHSVEVETNPKQ